MNIKKCPRWYNHKVNEGKTFFNETRRWFSGKSLQVVDENDIISGIGYFMRKNYSEDSKFEDVLEHLDGVLYKLRLVVMEEIRNDFSLGIWLLYLLNQT